METIGKKNKRPAPNEIFDFFKENRRVLTVVGYLDNRSVIYILYIVFLFILLTFVLIESAYALVIYSYRKELFVDAIHTFMLGVFSFGGLFMRFACHKWLQQCRDTIYSGFYQYEDEELDEEAREIIGKTRERAATGVRNAAYFCIVGGTYNVFFFGLLHRMSFTDEEYEELADLCNPYISNCMYLPFSTKTTIGFLTGYTINAFFMSYIYMMGATMLELYVSINAQLSQQLKLLNHMIRTIPQRAERLLLKTTGHKGPNLFEHPDYQACLYKCLRANIQHHQVLKRFHKESHPYNGSCILIMMIVAALVFGSRLYLIIKRPPFTTALNFAITLLTEQCYPLYVCLYGEAVLEESGRLFESLYSIPWYYCDKRFNQILNILMVHTQKPMRVKVLLFEVTASIETYGDVCIAIYKVSNILKQSDNKLN